MGVLGTVDIAELGRRHAGAAVADVGGLQLQQASIAKAVRGVAAATAAKAGRRAAARASSSAIAVGSSKGPATGTAVADKPGRHGERQ